MNRNFFKQANPLNWFLWNSMKYCLQCCDVLGVGEYTNMHVAIYFNGEPVK